jgi:hypothetical protein
VIVDRDNNSASGENAEDENLTPAWAKTQDQSEREVEKAALDMFQSNEEPRRGLEPLRIDLIEDRFEYLSGRKLVKEEKIVQRYRFLPMKADANQMLTGLGKGHGTWGASNLQFIIDFASVANSADRAAFNFAFDSASTAAGSVITSPAPPTAREPG